MKKIVKGLAGALCAGITALLVLTVYIQCTLPDEFYVVQGEELCFSGNLDIRADNLSAAVDAGSFGASGDKSYRVGVSFMGKVPIKEVAVQIVPRKMVVPGGNPFGIKMFTKGVMVVGMSDIQNGGESINPSKVAGMKIGDLLLSINGSEVQRNEDVAKHISQSGGSAVTITIVRAGQTMDVSLVPVRSEYDNGYKAGIWVRDSSAGIGTMTYYNPATLGFGGLGHAICDVDTGKVMPLSSGEIVDVNISGVNVGQSGKPGELRGNFVGGGSHSVGKLMMNTEMGIFGILNFPYLDAQPVPMAVKQEIQPGPGTILATVSGNKPQSFDIAIEKVNYSDTSHTKNMIIRIVDQRLLSTTGGIVQGMSGSPILQDGKLIGAITHVFVNDPTRGYGIFAENMDEMLKQIENNPIAA